VRTTPDSSFAPRQRKAAACRSIGRSMKSIMGFSKNLFRDPIAAQTIR
jgi:hypothetical protein